MLVLRPKARQIPEAMLCRILMFMWFVVPIPVGEEGEGGAS